MLNFCKGSLTIWSNQRSQSSTLDQSEPVSVPSWLALINTCSPFYYWLNYTNIHSSTCEVLSTARCCEEHYHLHRLHNSFTMWALRLHCPGALVQRWFKAPSTEWSRYSQWWLEKTTRCAISRVFPLWLILLQDQGWQHHIQCEHPRWFRFM